MQRKPPFPGELPIQLATMPSEAMCPERKSCATHRLWAQSLRHYPDTGACRPRFKLAPKDRQARPATKDDIALEVACLQDIVLDRSLIQHKFSNVLHQATDHFRTDWIPVQKAHVLIAVFLPTGGTSEL